MNWVMLCMGWVYSSIHVHLPWYCWRRAQGDNLEVYWCFWERLSAPSGLPLLARELWNHLCCKERTPWRGEERSLASLGGVHISPAQCCSCSLHRRGWYWRRLEATTEEWEDIQVARERVYNSFPSQFTPFDSSCKLPTCGRKRQFNMRLYSASALPPQGWTPPQSIAFSSYPARRCRLEDGKGVSDSETDAARTKLGKNEAESWSQL